MTAGGATLLSGAAGAWLGFVAPTSLVLTSCSPGMAEILAIEAGNHLVTFVLFGAFLGAWR